MKNIIYIFLIVSTLSFAQEKYQKVRIHYNSEAEKQQIILDNEIDHFHQKNGSFIECEIPETFVQNLKNTGKTVEVIIADMQAFVQQNISERNSGTSCSNAPTIIDPTNYNTGSMAGFLTYEECMAELDEMRSLYPNLITAKANVGTFLTFENRSLQFVKISDNPDVDETEKRILYDAVHHAREPGSMQQLIYFMWYLLENYGNDLEIKNLVDNTEIFCIPIVNPDGYIYNQTTNPNGGGYWRKNRRDHGDGTFGVDNNRNYGYNWGTTGVSTTDTTSDIYCGTAPFTEVENQAIKWFCEQKNFTIAINAHTFSSLVLYPFGYNLNQPTPDDDIYQGISLEMVKYSGYTNQLASALYPASGISDDWMYGDISTKPKIFAFIPEVGTSFWDSPAQTVINNHNMLHTNLTALRFLHNYATFEDKTQNLIATTNFNYDFSLKRLGLVDNQNFTVSITPFSSNILSVSGLQTFSNLAYNVDANGSFQMSLDPLIVQGDAITFIVDVNNGITTTSYSVTKTFGTETIIFDEPGDNLAQWTAFPNPSWGETSATSFSPSFCITDSPDVNYDDNSTTSISTTNTINLQNVVLAELSFYAKWDIEKKYDSVILEVKNGSGNWIPQCGKYTNINPGGPITGIDPFAVYDGVQSTWVKEIINLSGYIGSNIKIRFRFNSDSFGASDGFYFDDLKVSVLLPPLLTSDNFNFQSFSVSPNPTNSTLILNTISNIEKYKIYNISGQLLSENDLNTNKIDVGYLSDGIYFLELKNNDSKKVLKFVVKK